MARQSKKSKLSQTKSSGPIAITYDFSKKAEDDDEDVARKPSLIFACKARNVPGEHHGDKAIIVVPPGAKHGDVVTCSHPMCVSSGRRFRYCIVCNVPAAQRNFAQRHSHPQILSTTIATAPFPSMENSSTTTTEAGLEVQSTTPCLEIPSTEASLTPITATKAIVPETPAIPVPKVARLEPPILSIVYDHSSRKDVILTRQEYEWLMHLRSRPSNADLEGMKQWVNEILTIAMEPTTKQTNTNSVTNSELKSLAEPSNTVPKNDIPAVKVPVDSTPSSPILMDDLSLSVLSEASPIALDTIDEIGSDFDSVF